MRSGVWRDVVSYFSLVMALTVPFWIAGSIVQTRLMPGLSVSAFAIVVPMICACVVAAATKGPVALRLLFGSLARPGQHMLIVAAVSVLVPLLVAAFSWSLVAPGDRTVLAPLNLLALVPIFLLAAVAEEIGWSAFATERLSQKVSMVTAGLVVGLFWAAWHIPSLVELGHSANWIAWWSLWTVAQRLIMVCLYTRGNSWVWAPIIFHTISNVAWQAAPETFDPRVQGMAMAAIAALAAVTSFRRAS